MIYVGASLTHSGDTYKVSDPMTKRVHHSRNVIFRKKMYYRQDYSVSPDQFHPLNTTFEHLNVLYDVTDAHHPRPTPAAPSPPPESDAIPVPPLIPPQTAHISESSESSASSVSSVATYTTCADTFDEGFHLTALPLTDSA